MASPAQSSQLLQESLLRIQARLVSEEETRLDGLIRNGKQPITLPEIRHSQMHEAKLALLAELLASFQKNEDGQKDSLATATGTAFDYKEFSDRISPRIAVQCIFEPADESNGQRSQRRQPQPVPAWSKQDMRNAAQNGTQADGRNQPQRWPHSEKDQGRNNVDVKKRRQLQISEKAAAARKAQLRWQEKIRTDADRRREESQRQMDRMRLERDRQRSAAEQVRQRALKEEEAKRAEVAAQVAARVAAEEEEQRAREVECAVCYDSVDMGDAAQLPCMHWYCTEHLTRRLHLFRP
jgi:hypothetical protein